MPPTVHKQVTNEDAACEALEASAGRMVPTVALRHSDQERMQVGGVSARTVPASTTATMQRAVPVRWDGFRARPKLPLSKCCSPSLSIRQRVSALISSTASRRHIQDRFVWLTALAKHDGRRAQGTTRRLGRGRGSGRTVCRQGENRAFQRRGQPYTRRGKSGPGSKRVVVGLVERGGETRLFHIEHSTREQVRDVVVRNVSRESALHTDESNLYIQTGEEFASHRTVKHSGGEYVRYEDAGMVTTNTIENVFGVFRRGLHGVYQHCGEAHLHRYLNELHSA